MNVDEAIEHSRGLYESLFVQDPPDVWIAALIDIAETLETIKAARRTLEASYRAQGLGDADLRRVRRAVYGEYDDALLRLRRAVS